MLGSTVDFLTMMYYNVFTIREGEQRDEDGVKVTDNTDSYISIVAGVKSFLPKRGGGNIQPAGWN